GLLGCWGGSKEWLSRGTATKEQFEQVKIGMSEAEVEALLGQPTKKTKGHATLKNGTHAPIPLPYHHTGAGGAVIMIEFYGNRVTAREWRKPRAEGAPGASGRSVPADREQADG